MSLLLVPDSRMPIYVSLLVQPKRTAIGIQNKTLAGVDDGTINFGVVFSEPEYATNYEHHTILHEFGLTQPAATSAFYVRWVLQPLK